MQVSGLVVVRLPVAQVMAAFNDAEVLRAVLPSCVEARQVGPGRFAARLTRKVGPMPVTVEPQITVAPLQDGSTQLTIAAGNAILGRVQSALDLRLDPVEAGTRVSWTGDVQATGLAGRMLTDRKARIGQMVRNLFLRFKNAVEPGA